MKISKVETFHCDAGWRPWTFVKVETDEGLVGWGECSDSRNTYGLAGCIRDFEPLLRRVLDHERIIFASPIYWYAVAPAMKIFLDRISDCLELPDLLPEGRRLRGKAGYVVCTSASADASPAFMEAFVETFHYLGMRFGGALHADCRDGYVPTDHDAMAVEFAERVRGTTMAPA